MQYQCIESLSLESMRHNFPIGYKSLLDKKTTLLAINLMTKLLKENFC